MSIQVYMTDWWALHVCQEIQVKPSPLNSGFCILTLILFLEELGGMLQKGSCVFSLFGSRSVCCHCLLHQPLGWVSDVVYLRTAGKEKEVGERLKSTAYRWMRYRPSYILIFFFTVARERKDETMLEVTVVSCIWCFSHSHQLYVTVGIRNCHLLCESPALSWTVPLKCTPDQWMVTLHINCHNSPCCTPQTDSVQLKHSWPCNTQDLNPRFCQSRELARNICVRQKEKSRHVWCAGDTGQHCSRALHSPGVGELLCSGSCILNSLLQLLLRANVCHPLCVQDVLSHSHVTFICLSLARSLMACWECHSWSSSGTVAFSEVVSGQAARPQHKWLLCALYLLSLKERRLTESVFKNFLQWACHSTAVQCPMV